MLLYDRLGQKYQAIKTERPKSTRGVWESRTKWIDGKPVKFYHEIALGLWFYFQWKGEWYKAEIFGNAMRGRLGIESKEIFTTSP